jgi:molecular chaperone IbpA
MNYGKSLLPSTVGFDRLLSTMEEFDRMFEGAKVPTYPPYNIIKEDDTNYTIEIAVSGFKRDEIDITTEGNKLYVNGAISTAKSEIQYLHRGIGTRNFSHKYTVADTVVVKSADIVDGLLVIKLQNMIPEEKKPRKIHIGVPIGTKTTDLLTD